METQTLQVEVRSESGKGPARQLRASGRIPAVFYGPGVDTAKLTVSPKELIKALSTEMGPNAIFSLNVADGEHLAMVKDIQVHPVSRTPLHVDFYRVSTDREITVQVPVKTRGRAIGQQKGGKLQVIFRELPVRCTPDKLPAVIEVDVTHLDMNEVVKVEDVQLPEGVRILLPGDRRVINVGEAKRQALMAEDVAADAADAAKAAAAEAAEAPGAKK